MAVTGQNVINRLNNVFDDSGNAKWSAARKLEFVNMAIDAAWGKGIKNKKLDSSVTLASTTFEYTPTASDVSLEDGFATAYVTPDNTSTETKVRLRSIAQRLSGTTWTVVVPTRHASDFAGNVLHLEYNARYARLAAATDSVELPLDYLYYAAAMEAVLGAIGAQSPSGFNTKPMEPLVPVYEQRLERLAISLRRGHVTKLPVTYDHGRVAD